MEVTTALLADAATVSGGKLYVHGGGWDHISAASTPVMHPSMSLAIVLRVEYGEMMKDIRILVELLDEDGHPVPPGVRVEGNMRVGLSPTARRGDPTMIPQAMTFPGMRFESFGRYVFRISSDGEFLQEVPFSIIRHPSHGKPQSAETPPESE